MEIKLKINTSPSNYVNKSTSTIRTVETNEVEVKGNLDLWVTIPVTYWDNSVNYASVTEFNSSYFVREKERGNGVFRVHLHKDILSSRWNSISSSRAIISRQQNTTNLYVPDGDIPLQNRKNTILKKFPSTMEDITAGRMYILVQGSGSVATTTSE